MAEISDRARVCAYRPHPEEDKVSGLTVSDVYAAYGRSEHCAA
jgi:hypothetical protein